MDDVLVRVSPPYWYWLLGLIIYPLAGFVFTAISLGILLGIFDPKTIEAIPPQLVIAIWIVLTISIALWACARDYRRMFFILTTSSLKLGGSLNRAEVRFEEIDSIVLGLPAQQSKWIRILVFVSGNNVISIYRNQCILIRLSGRRYLPLLPISGLLKNLDMLTREFLNRNAHKVVGRETYSDLEKAKLGGFVHFNSLSKW
jgi:hypothetical protein